jgi:DegV family protein with EDD domain
MGSEHSEATYQTVDETHPPAAYRRPVGQVAVVTDSVAQVPTAVADRLGINVVPLAVHIGDERFLDGVDLAPTELYRRMRLEKIAPTTSAPSIGQYLEVFRACFRDGAKAVLHVSLSSKLSTAYDSSCQAAEMVSTEFPSCPVEVLDSRQGAISQGFIAIAAARAAAADLQLEEVTQRARAAMPRSGIVVSLATLEYLARGGRIGKAAYWVGSLINLHPLITLDSDGVAAPVARVRGESRAREVMVDWVVRNVRGHSGVSLAVMEADAPEAADRLRELALQKMQPEEVFHSDFTPVMGVHTGPGLVGLGYYFES